MDVTCPKCKSKQQCLLESARIPSGATTETCEECSHKFGVKWLVKVESEVVDECNN